MTNFKSISVLSATALFLAACTPAPQVKQAPVKAEKPKPKKPQAAMPAPPKKKIELEEVQDDNYSPEYMYPEDKYKKDKLVEKKPDASEEPLEKASASMSREECIGMIGQEKFDKYTEMFGNEAASIKRCTLLRSMQKS